ncbi:MAG: SURF1 family protein [Gammaproteobacteria bacterium]|nr:SURF1 family protein [Gammaproteobacteria bacterium]
MRLGNFEFTPALWPTLATLLLLPLLTGLGVWQLERADWKQGLVDAHSGRTRLSPVSLKSLTDINEAVQYRRVFARGYYDVEHQLLLDNRTYQGYAGYHVLTPLLLAESEQVVLVNRGWVPVGNDRSVLPDLPATTGEVLVDATVKLPPSKLFRLGALDETHAGWPQVVQQLEMKELEQRLGVTLQPLILLLSKDDEFGFIRDWKAVYGVTPDKHRAYAIQWFSLAVVLLLIYMGVNSKRVTNK